MLWDWRTNDTIASSLCSKSTMLLVPSTNPFFKLADFIMCILCRIFKQIQLFRVRSINLKNPPKSFLLVSPNQVKSLHQNNQIHSQTSNQNVVFHYIFFYINNL